MRRSRQLSSREWVLLTLKHEAADRIPIAMVCSGINREEEGDKQSIKVMEARKVLNSVRSCNRNRIEIIKINLPEYFVLCVNIDVRMCILVLIWRISEILMIDLLDFSNTM